MLKVIVSHDVDHLYARDHWFRDMFYPKFWIRSTIQMIKGEITLSEWGYRFLSCFEKDRSNIAALTEFDLEHGIEASFFFGMAQGLGLSYRPEEAKKIIQTVRNRGFLTGVHGIAFESLHGIANEKRRFTELMGYEPCGIRMHYVRKNDNTPYYESEAGYFFDTSEFNKEKAGTVKAPYKIDTMWEFPLQLMDSYLTGNLRSVQQQTIARINECKKAEIGYLTVLFHNDHFCKGYGVLFEWYKWFVRYVEDAEDMSFCSYEQAIKELENK